MGYPSTEEAEIDEIVRGFLSEQSRAAAQQRRPLRRATHAKGVCVGATFEVLDVAQEGTAARDPTLAARLARGIYARPAAYAATVRFASSDPRVNSDWEPDVRGMSFAVQLSGTGSDGARQDYSLQSAPTLPFNDVRAFVVFAKVFAARSERVGVGSLGYREQLVFARTKQAVIQQKRQTVRPYQQLRYWSNVPFRHGPTDIVKYSATPSAGNQARALDQLNPNAIHDELARHVNEDQMMASFDFGLQFLDLDRMTYQGTRREAAFWIENASVEWPEAQSPFHTVARLTLAPKSHVCADACEAAHIDVTENSTSDSAPVGRVNHARWYAEVASRKARAGKQ